MRANGEAAEGPPPVRSQGGRRWGGVALHGNDAGSKMAAAGAGGAGGLGAGPRGRWGGCLWVRGVLLVLGGLPAGAAAAPVSLSTSPPCRHHVPSDTEVISKVHLKTNHVVRRDTDGYLRIKTVYDASIEEQCATNQYLRKENDPHRYCTGECAVHTKCGPVTVPEEHLQQCRVCREGKWPCGAVGVLDHEGVQDADFILYVGALATERCSHENIISYAAYCQQEAKMDRPIAGYANLCPNMISTQPQEFIGMLSTVKHEIIHALRVLEPESHNTAHAVNDGDFMANLKELRILRQNGLDGHPSPLSLGLYQWSDKVVRKVERQWNVRNNKIVRHTVYLLVTPRVVEEARKHFNCPVLEGMELENQGGMGTELNHWEKRLLENEAMTGSHTQNRVLSRITLALMEDTGWYKANYSMAEKLDWGRGMGCEFVRKSCKFWIDQQRQKRQVPSPYCDTLRSNPLQLTCRQDQRAVAVCNLQRFPDPLPPEYQYFDELSGISAEDLPYYGGSVEIADYCPFSQEFSWHLSGEYQRSSDCRILENQPEMFKNYGAEKYGPHSVCLLQKSAFVMEQCERKLSYPDWGSGCYQVSCSPQGLKVWVQDTSYLCSRAGQVLPVRIQMNGWIHNGNLLCPSCWDFCEQCPPETDPPAANLTRALPLGLTLDENWSLLALLSLLESPAKTLSVLRALPSCGRRMVREEPVPADTEWSLQEVMDIAHTSQPASLGTRSLGRDHCPRVNLEREWARLFPRTLSSLASLRSLGERVVANILSSMDLPSQDALGAILL
ncbi:Leishmanolysin-like peptidase [Microtus ochrogaster]|uniref:Leishmanolysin-like peptidase n=1 Tax=Microtus ochrogaster TaxID=79684 RepID=A0A8J6G557_MICOH|nr:Leishmanolysin-like peptidase [Microtus ochrogaster]